MPKQSAAGSRSTLHELFPIGLIMAICAVFVLGLGLPLVLLATHGFNVAAWPRSAPTPSVLLYWLLNLRFDEIWHQYVLMWQGAHPGLHGGGYWQLIGLLALSLVLALSILFGTVNGKGDRDPSGQLGDARWANGAEKRKLNSGLEIGLDPESGKPVRIRTDGNLLTVAPPRTGKTSGLIINNLLVPDRKSWSGPAVVLDPKGDIYDAVHKRREALGRRVIKFDLRDGGVDSGRWNPLESANVDNIAHLQSVAAVLIPNMGKENSYFGVRGIDIFVGAAAAALEDARMQGKTATPADVADLLSDHGRLLAIAHALNQKVFKSVTADLQLDERSRDQLLSTARAAVQWLQDQRFQSLTTDATFTMDEIASGESDLFLIVPKESAKLLAPLLRWMFTELFAAINRRGGASERIVMFVDEADSMGKFEELRTALTLMPGRGLSVWSFWQSFSQIEEHYGRQGAETFRSSAAVTTISNVGHLSDDAERISRALGDLTILVDGASEQTSASGQSVSSSRQRQARRLLKDHEVTGLPDHELIALLNLKGTTRHPLRLNKVQYFEEPRFKGLYETVEPVGVL